MAAVRHLRFVVSCMKNVIMLTLIEIDNMRIILSYKFGLKKLIHVPFLDRFYRLLSFAHKRKSL